MLQGNLHDMEVDHEFKMETLQLIADEHEPDLLKIKSHQRELFKNVACWMAKKVC